MRRPMKTRKLKVRDCCSSSRSPACRSSKEALVGIITESDFVRRLVEMSEA
jgi:hypothetical protein